MVVEQWLHPPFLWKKPWNLNSLIEFGGFVILLRVCYLMLFSFIPWKGQFQWQIRSHLIELSACFSCLCHDGHKSKWLPLHLQMHELYKNSTPIQSLWTYWPKLFFIACYKHVYFSCKVGFLTMEGITTDSLLKPVTVTIVWCLFKTTQING